MRFEILFTEEIFQNLLAHLLSGKRAEQLAFILCGQNKISDETTKLLACKLIIPHGKWISQSYASVSFSREIGRCLFSICKKTRFHILSCHSHPFSQEAWFSSIDNEWDCRLSEYITSRIPDIHYGSIVVGTENTKGRIYNNSKSPNEASLKVIGNKITEIVHVEQAEELKV